MAVQGLNTEGKRDILAVEPMYEESKASYTKVFNQLKERGLEISYRMHIKGWSK